jgi:hypothetical protein
MDFEAPDEPDKESESGNEWLLALLGVFAAVGGLA